MGYIPAIPMNPNWTPTDITSDPILLTGPQTPVPPPFSSGITNYPIPIYDVVIIPYQDNAFTFDPITGMFGGRYVNYQLLHFKGYYKAPVTGTYSFQIQSDDGIYMTVGAEVVVDSWIIRYSDPPSYSQKIYLNKDAYYVMHIYYFNEVGPGELIIRPYVDGDRVPFGSQIFQPQ
jgi:hypothetical protein